MGRRTVQEPAVEPEMLPRETVPVDQTGPVAVAESNDYPVRVGGWPMFVVTLTTALSVAGELEFYKNGTLFATEVLPTGTTGPIQFGRWPRDISVDPTPVVFRAGDKARVAITDAGTGGEGFHGEWRFG